MDMADYVDEHRRIDGFGASIAEPLCGGLMLEQELLFRRSCVPRHSSIGTTWRHSSRYPHSFYPFPFFLFRINWSHWTHFCLSKMNYLSFQIGCAQWYLPRSQSLA